VKVLTVNQKKKEIPTTMSYMILHTGKAAHYIGY